MMLTYGVIKGERDLRNYCQKRWQQYPLFNGVFAHIGNCTIELIYEQTHDEGQYEQYYILYMPHERGVYDEVTIRSKVYEDIRAGRVSLLKV